MKKLYTVLAAGSVLACAASAQDDRDVIFEKMAPQVRIMSLQGGMMTKPVKGAPYSGLEISENTQMLADGTRIHNENQTQVYRDSEGRMRRETPNEVTIWDPVANTSYVLNPKTQTARKLPMGTYAFNTTRNVGGEVVTYSVRTVGPGGPGGPPEVGFRTGPGEPDARAALDKMKAELKSEIEMHMRTAGGPEKGFSVVSGSADMQKKLMAEKAATESLGKRMIEGVNSEGTKYVTTIDAGAIGNDRPIQSVTEKWFSPELQITMLLRHTDPRMGEEVSKVVNVNRSEPAAYLFQVPAGYQMVDQK